MQPFKRTVRFVFIFYAILIAGLNTPAFAKPTVRWAVNDLTPFFIMDGPYKGQGISDKLTRFFQQKLHEYHHDLEDMTFSRFYALAQRGDLVCNALLLKTDDRQEFLTFSRKMKPAYTHVLVSNYPMTYPKGGLSIADYIQAPNRKLIVQTHRSYGPLLDQLITQGRQDNRVEDFNFPTKQLFIMMEKGRIDHFLDIENSVTYYQALHKGPGKFYNIPIKEDRLDHFGHVACSKTKDGQLLMGKINAVLKKHADDPAFRRIIETWIAPENLKRFRSFYDQQILK